MLRSEAVNTNFYGLWFDSTGNRAFLFTVSVADALSPRPLIGTRLLTIETYYGVKQVFFSQKKYNKINETGGK